MAQVVDDEHGVLVETGESIAETQCFLGALQALYERRDGHELDPDASLCQAITDAAGQVQQSHDVVATLVSTQGLIDVLPDTWVTVASSQYAAPMCVVHANRTDPYDAHKDDQKLSSNKRMDVSALVRPYGVIDFRLSAKP